MTPYDTGYNPAREHERHEKLAGSGVQMKTPKFTRATFTLARSLRRSCEDRKPGIKTLG